MLLLIRQGKIPETFMFGYTFGIQFSYLLSTTIYKMYISIQMSPMTSLNNPVLCTNLFYLLSTSTKLWTFFDNHLDTDNDAIKFEQLQLPCHIMASWFVYINKNRQNSEKIVFIMHILLGS